TFAWRHRFLADRVSRRLARGPTHSVHLRLRQLPESRGNRGQPAAVCVEEAGASAALRGGNQDAAATGERQGPSRERAGVRYATPEIGRSRRVQLPADGVQLGVSHGGGT